MLFSRKVKCRVCGLEEEALLEKRENPTGEHFCTEHHLEVFVQATLTDKARKRLRVQAGFEEEKAPEILKEEVSGPADAEFIFFLFNIKAICSTDLIKVLLTKENLSSTYKALQRQQSEKKLRDFLLITDIFKLALRKEIPAVNKTFVIQTVHNILRDAKIAALGREEAPPEIEREIYTMIAKNTIDTFVDIHVFKPEPRDADQQPDGHGFIEDEQQDKGTPPPVHILALSEVSVFKAILELAENPLVINRIDLTSLDPTFSDLTVQNVADTIKIEGLDMADFCIVHKFIKLDLLGEETVKIRRVVVGETLENWVKGDSYLLSRNIKSRERYDPKTMVTVHFTFDAVTFGQEFDLCYNLSLDSGLEEIEERIEVILNGMFVLGKTSSSAKGQRVISFRLPDDLRKVFGLNDLLVCRDIENKVFHIQVTPSFISTKIEEEDSLYSENEKVFYNSFLTDVKTPKYLEEVAGLTELTKEQVEKELKKLFLDPSLESLSEERKESVMALRCCRLLLQVERSKTLNGVHRYSHVFPNLAYIPSPHLGLDRELINPQAAARFRENFSLSDSSRSSHNLTRSD